MRHCSFAPSVSSQRLTRRWPDRSDWTPLQPKQTWSSNSGSLCLLLQACTTCTNLTTTGDERFIYCVVHPIKARPGINFWCAAWRCRASSSRAPWIADLAWWSPTQAKALIIRHARQTPACISTNYTTPFNAHHGLSDGAGDGAGGFASHPHGRSAECVAGVATGGHRVPPGLLSPTCRPTWPLKNVAVLKDGIPAGWSPVGEVYRVALNPNLDDAETVKADIPGEFTRLRRTVLMDCGTPAWVMYAWQPAQREAQLSHKSFATT